MTARETYEAMVPVAVAAARNAVARRFRTDPDFLQDVRLRAWRAALHAARRGRLSDLVPFACVIGRHAAIDHVLRLRPMGFREAVVNAGKAPHIVNRGSMARLQVPAPAEPDPFTAEALLAVLSRADLTLAERASVLLGMVNGLTHAEIAERLGVTQPAAKRIRVSALAKIRGVLA